ncbi:MAG: aldose 1-epimerase family protein [Sphaerochaeta sp.]|nr:aldose 1-epimerase family protein [Sphaerochaeta sp.]
MKKQEILSYVGNMQQVASIQPVSYTEGVAKGLGAYLIRNGDLSFTVMQDKCLDIAQLSYKGINMSFLSKPGLQHTGRIASKSDRTTIMGGFLFTAGLENVGEPATLDKRNHPLHGEMRAIPAEHVSARASWVDDEYLLAVSGEMRESELFGPNLLLRREIRTTFPGKSFTITDEIENQAFHDEPFLLLYHINFGYPFLTEKCVILIPSEEVVPINDISGKHVDTWDRMEKPIPGKEEYVFRHTLAKRQDGTTIVGIYNTELKIGVSIAYDPEILPHCMEWKTLGSGDYALGLEPANVTVAGRQYHQDDKSLPMLRSFEKRIVELKITIVDGDEEFEHVKALIADMKGSISE